MAPMIRRKKVCNFHSKNATKIDYTNIFELTKAVTNTTMKFIPSRITGTCTKHQRELVRAIKLARFLALMPYTDQHKGQQHNHHNAATAA